MIKREWALTKISVLALFTHHRADGTYLNNGEKATDEYAPANAERAAVDTADSHKKADKHREGTYSLCHGLSLCACDKRDDSAYDADELVAHGGLLNIGGVIISVHFVSFPPAREERGLPLVFWDNIFYIGIAWLLKTEKVVKMCQKFSVFGILVTAL